MGGVLRSYALMQHAVRRAFVPPGTHSPQPEFTAMRHHSDYPFLPRLFLFVILATTAQPIQFAIAAPASRVTFNDEGVAFVDGKPFFPIGVFTYNIDPTVLAELHEVQCNTVLNGFNPD